MFVLVSSKLYSQDHYYGLYSNYYLESNNGSSGILKKINKSIYIVYNKNYCGFYLSGKGITVFSTRGYESKIVENFIHTSFVNEETTSIPEAYYAIMIDQSKNKNMFQVALPNGYTYLVEQASAYSENGIVKSNPEVININKKIENQINLAEQSKLYWDTVNNFNFNISPNLRKKHLLCKTNISEFINSKINFHTENIEKEIFYGAHIIFDVSKTGEISRAEIDLSKPNLKSQTIELINDFELRKKILTIFKELKFETELGTLKTNYNCELNIVLTANPVTKK